MREVITIESGDMFFNPIKFLFWLVVIIAGIYYTIGKCETLSYELVKNNNEVVGKFDTFKECKEWAESQGYKQEPGTHATFEMPAIRFPEPGWGEQRPYLDLYHNWRTNGIIPFIHFSGRSQVYTRDLPQI